MSSGRNRIGACGKSAVALFASFLWVLALLSTIQATVAPVSASQLPRLPDRIAAPAEAPEGTSNSGAYALPGTAAALVDKRPSTAGSPFKNSADPASALVEPALAVAPAVSRATPRSDLRIDHSEAVLGADARAPPTRV